MGNLGEWLNGRVVVSKTIGCVFESRLPCHRKKERVVRSFFLWQGGRDCIRKFLRMQKLRVTLAFVTTRNLYRPKSLDTSRSLFRRSHCSLLTNRVLTYDSKAGRPFFFVAGETRLHSQFLRMRKLRVTLAVVKACPLFRSNPLDTSRSLFRRSLRSLLTNRVINARKLE